jgi:cytidine deaminase
MRARVVFAIDQSRFEMNDEFQFLIEAAAAGRLRSYLPYSRFAVGAALRSTSGGVFTGTNVENISFGLTLCAERAAVASAVGAGSRDFDVIALVSDSAEPVVPCGACRQVLAEFNTSLRIISQTLSGSRREECLADLLPSPHRGILSHAQG